jgi:hypothetical protein
MLSTRIGTNDREFFANSELSYSTHIMDIRVHSR